MVRAVERETQGEHADINKPAGVPFRTQNIGEFRSLSWAASVTATQLCTANKMSAAIKIIVPEE